MKTRNGMRRSERGQAIVILTFGMVTLLAFFALAVDGGMYYSDRRDAQSAADAAVLSAAAAICQGEDGVEAGEFIALQNGYDGDGVTNEVHVYDPPQNGTYAGQDNYIEVVITSYTHGSISSLIGQRSLSSTVHSVGYCGSTGSSSSVTVNPAIKNAGVVLLQPSGKILHFNSNGRMEVSGGTLFVNSSADPAIWLDSNAELHAGGLDMVGGIFKRNNSDLTGPVNSVAAIDPNSVFPDLAPPAKPSGSCVTVNVDSNHSLTIDPGLYCSIHTNSNASLTLNPGIYWIEYGGITMDSNSNIDASSGVLFYMGPNASYVHLNSNTTIDIVPMSTGPYAGLSYYQNNSQDMTIDSNSTWTSSVAGTFYMPYANVHLNSNSNVVLSAQIISKSMSIDSNAEVYINLGDSIYYGQDAESLSVSLAE